MATIRVKRRAGEPSSSLMGRNWPSIRKPMRPIRSVRTLMKRDEAKGVEQPEFKNTLQRAGVGSRVKAKVLSRQRPNTPPGFSTRPGKMIPPPSPTNRGGVKKR